MKYNSYKNCIAEQQARTNHWDAFRDYLENIYFPGATEILDKQTIAFEYDSFKNCFSVGC